MRTSKPVFVLMILISSLAWSLPSAREHTTLWVICLGLSENSSADSTLRDVSSAIDIGLKDRDIQLQVERMIPEITAKLPSSFKFGVEGSSHRKVFHWGLMFKPYKITHSEEARPLRTMFIERIKRLDMLEQQEKEKLQATLFEVIGKEWEKRQKDIFRGVRSLYGNNTDAMANIIYEVHILSDFLDSRISDLGPMSLHFEQGLIKEGLERLPRSEKLIQELKHAYHQQPPISKEELERMGQGEQADLHRLLWKNEGMHDETRRRAFHLLMILGKELPLLLQSS